jgi:hypothetical protein
MTDSPTSPALYSAVRNAPQGVVTEWQGRAETDEAAAHRLAQHLKEKLDQGAAGYTPEDLVTLCRPDGEMVTAVRAEELIRRMHGWNTADENERGS